MTNLEECSYCNTTTRGVFTLYQTFASKTQRTSTMFFKKKKKKIVLFLPLFSKQPRESKIRKLCHKKVKYWFCFTSSRDRQLLRELLVTDYYIRSRWKIWRQFLIVWDNILASSGNQFQFRIFGEIERVWSMFLLFSVSRRLNLV